MRMAIPRGLIPVTVALLKLWEGVGRDSIGGGGLGTQSAGPYITTRASGSVVRLGTRKGRRVMLSCVVSPKWTLQPWK